MSFLTTNGLTLHYRIDGPKHGPALVFANSLGSDLRIWDGVVDRLSNDYRCLRYDKRGHGLSDCPPAPYSIRDHTDDLAGLIEHTSLDRPTVAGISIGGRIALDFAAVYPDRVRAVVICDTVPGTSRPESWQERIDTVRRLGVQELADSIVERWFTPAFRERNPAAWHGYRNMVARAPIEGYIGSCAALRDSDLSDAAAQNETTKLMLTGSLDGAAQPEQVRIAAAGMRNASFIEIPEAGHLTCIEQPDLVAAAIREFLEGLDDAG